MSGQTVHYTEQDDGEVEIVFVDNGSPFLDLNGQREEKGHQQEPPIELKKDGDFTGRCYITTPDGKKLAGTRKSMPVAIM